MFSMDNCVQIMFSQCIIKSQILLVYVHVKNIKLTFELLTVSGQQQ